MPALFCCVCLCLLVFTILFIESYLRTHPRSQTLSPHSSLQPNSIPAPIPAAKLHPRTHPCSQTIPAPIPAAKLMLYSVQISLRSVRFGRCWFVVVGCFSGSCKSGWLFRAHIVIVSGYGNSTPPTSFAPMRGPQCVFLVGDGTGGTEKYSPPSPLPPLTLHDETTTVHCSVPMLTGPSDEAGPSP